MHRQKLEYVNFVVIQLVLPTVYQSCSHSQLDCCVCSTHSSSSREKNCIPHLVNFDHGWSYGSDDSDDRAGREIVLFPVFRITPHCSPGKGTSEVDDCRTTTTIPCLCRK